MPRLLRAETRRRSAPGVSQAIERRLQQTGVWTLGRRGTIAITWDRGTFYALIEAFHDLAARPRRVWWDNSDAG